MTDGERLLNSPKAASSTPAASSSAAPGQPRRGENKPNRIDNRLKRNEAEWKKQYYGAAGDWDPKETEPYEHEDISILQDACRQMNVEIPKYRQFRGGPPAGIKVGDILGLLCFGENRRVQL